MDYVRIVRALLNVSPDQLVAKMSAAPGADGENLTSPPPLLAHEGLAAGLRAVTDWYRAALPATATPTRADAGADNATLHTYLALRSRWEDRQAQEMVLQITERTRRPTAAGAPAGARRRALLVDDASDVIVTVSAFLESFGFDVTRASSGDAALTTLAEGHQFDLLVTDHAMPGMTGKDLALQACQMNKALRALIITGYPDAHELSVLPTGIMLLAKPFRRAELAESVRRLFATAEAANMARAHAE